jgi:hypothetical protein
MVSKSHQTLTEKGCATEIPVCCRIMKCSAFYPIVAGLALGAMLLPATALAENEAAHERQVNCFRSRLPWAALELKTVLEMACHGAGFC